MTCEKCGLEMEHICSWVCVDICWRCHYRKSPQMMPRGWSEADYIAKDEERRNAN